MPIPDVIAYRYNESLVYVPPAQSLQEAIELARQNYRELAGVNPDYIALYVNGLVGGERRKIRVSAMAWEPMLPKFRTFEVLDIAIETPSNDEPPDYEDNREKCRSVNSKIASSREPTSSSPLAASSSNHEGRSLPAKAGKPIILRRIKSLFGKHTA
ncbi:hypothetical protein C8Q74DRAFT_1215626 [Fomes fomentarius]|nr:hypothetical protein C8Q74DRAFT_1215626 [Fomes fomentarius]